MKTNQSSLLRTALDPLLPEPLLFPCMYGVVLSTNDDDEAVPAV